MASVGQQLLQPESGWKRYNDTNTNITYLGVWRPYSAIQYSNDVNKRIQFNFTGSKLRILSYVHGSYSSNVKISIDKTEYSFAENIGDTLFNVVVFETTTLSSTEHYVEIYTNSTDAHI